MNVIPSLFLAASLTCPQHLAPSLTGWISPSVCEGNGRQNDITQSEVQAERNVYQGNGYLADVLRCWRLHLDELDMCLHTALNDYHDKQMENLEKQPGAPPCLIEDAQTDAHRASLDDLLFGLIYPILYCEQTNTLRQLHVSNALTALSKDIARVHLESAIGEHNINETIKGEIQVHERYERITNRIPLGEPVCLTQSSVHHLGMLLRAWMDVNSDRAFCAR